MSTMTEQCAHAFHEHLAKGGPEAILTLIQEKKTALEKQRAFSSLLIRHLQTAHSKNRQDEILEKLVRLLIGIGDLEQATRALQLAGDATRIDVVGLAKEIEGQLKLAF